MDPTDESRWLIAELDFGHSPDGMLVVREARWQRIVGMICGLFVGIPTAWAAIVIGIRFGDVGSALIVSVFSGIALGGAVWLLYELLNANCYYFAIDDKRFYRRRGPHGLISFPLSELGDFLARIGTLYACHKSTQKQIPVMKNAYAPEDIALLARRVNIWRSTPQAQRGATLTHLNLLEAARARFVANKQIAWSLSVLCFYPILIVLSLKFQFFRAPTLATVLWVLYTLAAMVGLFGGIVRRFRATPKISTAQILLIAMVCFCLGCQESIPPKPPRSLSARVKQPLSERAVMDALGVGQKIRGLIQDLAKIKDPNFGLSPTMSGSGFAPVPAAGRMFNGILMNHGFKDDSSFLKLVEIGPPALPYLLESLTDSTPTHYTIDYTNVSFGGMWYGERPALRWVAGEAFMIERMAEGKVSDKEIAERFAAPPEFIALAKAGKLPHFSPQSQGEFNPKNLVEQSILAKARKELPSARSDKNDDPFGSAIRSYTITVGDVCYVLVGQITNRTYQAAQYQPTACTYIISPVHDARLAADVRAVWTTGEPTEMLYQSLQADLAAPRRLDVADALVRLGYYYPDRCESVLLENVAKVEAGDKEVNDSSYETLRLIPALLGSKNKKVRDRLFKLLQTARDPYFFIDLQEGFGREHDPLILKRAMSFIEGLPQEKEARGDESLLKMMSERFPEQALPIYKQFAASPSTNRRNAVINTLWYSNPLSPELLLPLLDDKRLMGHYTAGDRVCDRAAQAISHAIRVVEFDSDFPETRRDELIQKIKAHCLGIGNGKASAAGQTKPNSPEK
jgi:hypothetical protein